MKKLSLMLALVLALGVFATACSEDDEATGTKVTFKAYHDSQNVLQTAVFVDDTAKGFEMLQYTDAATPAILYGWRGTYAVNTNVKTATVTATNWNDNGAGWTDTTTLSETFKTGFAYTYDGTSLITSAKLTVDYGLGLTTLTKATN